MGSRSPGWIRGAWIESPDLVEAGTPLEQWPGDFFRVDDNIRRSGLLLSEAPADGSGLRSLLAKGTDVALAEVERSGLRGRGGAGFATASKWKLCRGAKGAERFVVCNADEGEPGTFKDRVLLTSYLDLVLEGMTICAGIIEARKGFLYLRGEYRYLLRQLEAVLARRRERACWARISWGSPASTST